MDVSVVIPTRNRPESLSRLLKSLSLQTLLPAGVIIVDASEQSIEHTTLRQQFPRLNLRVLHSAPSVCRQRNIGIRETTSPYIFLCDDDMEPPPEYIERAADYFEQNPDAGAVSGLVLEPLEEGTFNDGFHPVSLSTLLSNFIFQHTVWADLSQMHARFPGSLLLYGLRRYYQSRGNTFTLAGWPLLTNVDHPVTQTAIYGLGGSIVRREWLIESPFDETLDEYGIGDNYGVALGLPGTKPITVLTTVSIYHHKVADNRLPRSEAYSRRVLALDYFMAKSRRFSPSNRLLLRWSVIGNLLGSFLNRQSDMSLAARRTLWRLLAGRNQFNGIN